MERRTETAGIRQACGKAVRLWEYQRMNTAVYCRRLRRQGRWLDYVLERIRLRRIARRRQEI